MTAPDIERMLDLHLVRIVNTLRATTYERRVPFIASMLNVPEWLVLRIGHDGRLLTPVEEAAYEATRTAP